jgi:hypothetical protein
LFPDSVGRYAQLWATLTPGVESADVKFTATPLTSHLSADIATAKPSHRDDSPMVSGETPQGPTAQATNSAEVTYRQDGSESAHEIYATAPSSAQVVSTASLGSFRPGTFLVTASVVNTDGTTVISNTVEVKWIEDQPHDGEGYGYDRDGDSDYGRSDGPYYSHRRDSYSEYQGSARRYGDPSYRSDLRLGFRTDAVHSYILTPCFKCSFAETAGAEHVRKHAG